jgi:hypothetical protein
VSNLDTVLAFLRGKGLTPAQAAGVAGNLSVESGIDPTAHNDREGAIGIAQWEGGRRTALDRYAAATGGSETDLTTQLNYLWSELQGPEAGALRQLRAAQDAGTAAAVFDQSYERSSGAARSTRVDRAKSIAAYEVGATSGLPGWLTSLLGGGLAPSSTAPAAQDVGNAVSDLTNGWANDAMTIGLKVLGAAAAAGLVIVGAVHTVSSK